MNLCCLRQITKFHQCYGKYGNLSSPNSSLNLHLFLKDTGNVALLRQEELIFSVLGNCEKNCISIL